MDFETDPVESEPWCTQEDFWRFCQEERQDDLRHELLNGRIVMTPVPAWPHARAAGRLFTKIDEFVTKHGLGEVFAENGYEMPGSQSTIGPDVSFVSAEKWRSTGPHDPARFLRVVPDLVVEVLSPSTSSYDRGEKKGIYERFGVREYWIADVNKANIARFVLRDGFYGMPTLFGIDDTVESVSLEGLRFQVREILPAK